eukprot:Em0001g43a
MSCAMAMIITVPSRHWNNSHLSSNHHHDECVLLALYESSYSATMLKYNYIVLPDALGWVRMMKPAGGLLFTCCLAAKFSEGPGLAKKVRQRRDGPIAITPPRQLPEFPNNLVGVFALLMWAVAIMSVEAYGIQQAIQMVEIRAT